MLSVKITLGCVGVEGVCACAAYVRMCVGTCPLVCLERPEGSMVLFCHLSPSETGSLYELEAKVPASKPH